MGYSNLRIVAFLALMMSSGCQTTKQIETGNYCSNFPDLPRPVWTFNSKLEGHYVGVGVTKYQLDGEKKQRQMARQDAIKNLAQTLVTNVVSSNEQTIASNNGEINQSADYFSKLVSKIKLERVEIEEWWPDKDTCQVWAIVKLSKKEATELIEKHYKEQKREDEITLWEGIKNSDNTDDYETYLALYKNGIFAQQATRKIESIAAAKKVALKKREIEKLLHKRRKVKIKTISDSSFFLDKSAAIIVTSALDESLYGNKLVDHISEKIKSHGYKISINDKYDYILTLRFLKKVSKSPKYKHDSVYIGDSKFVEILSNEQEDLEGISLRLYDSTNPYNPTLVWVGSVVGGKSLNGYENSSISSLVSKIGNTFEGEVVLQQGSDDIAAPTQRKSHEIRVGDSKFFGVKRMRINEMTGRHQSKFYKGYIRTKRVRTRKFNGYVETTGMKEYSFLSNERDELTSWNLGLGAFSVKPDGIYTTDYTISEGARGLDDRSLKKIFNLRPAVGDQTVIDGPVNTYLKYRIKSREPLITPYGRLDECLVIQFSMSESRNSFEFQSDTWVCSGVGIAKVERVTGRTDVLTNVKYFD